MIQYPFGTFTFTKLNVVSLSVLFARMSIKRLYLHGNRCHEMQYMPLRYEPKFNLA